MTLHNGLQLDVLKLYIHFLKALKPKDVSVQTKFREYLRHNFKQNSKKFKKTDVVAIEHLLRQGKKTLEVYSSSECKNIRLPKAD